MSVHTEGAVRQCAAAMLTLAVVAENQRIENYHDAKQNVKTVHEDMMGYVMADDDDL